MTEMARHDEDERYLRDGGDKLRDVDDLLRDGVRDDIHRQGDAICGFFSHSTGYVPGRDASQRRGPPARLEHVHRLHCVNMRARVGLDISISCQISDPSRTIFDFLGTSYEKVS